ncbi:hypothetical protein MUK42_03750 [Musa troglodytarum]|uniref:Clu domain-containing protein n=1 Tax=Musa troglodytarum TaxID=320322 RepID=A0A9E7KZY2_9LILI|nr:hypothetical protein MUK42_03750 [Musa troglodytarum]
MNALPYPLQLVGDLIYMDVVSLEGNKYCITGTTRGFYVNSSTARILDPRPLKPAYETSTLIGLLQKISSKFKKGFREILDRKASTHPFESVQSLLPPNTWLGVYPIPDHKRDPARAEDSLSLSFGSELIGMPRDWNEELQSCREFPHKTLQERILRERALYKVTCDFVDAAIEGAIGVISRCIPPINPTDPECFHMYVHNNIFFSFAVDAVLGHMSKSQEANVQMNSRDVSENCEDKVSCNPPARTSGNKLFGATANSSLCISTSPDKEQKQGVSDLMTDASAEVQIADSEQATYASANNDLKGTKAYQEADVPGLYNLAMAIVDYRGYRVVAQSIIPGILQGDKSNSLLYGSVDNGKKICWNESFHSKVVEAAKCLHLKEHMVLDGSKCCQISCSSRMQGAVDHLLPKLEANVNFFSFRRHYLLDLMRVTPRDANYIGPAHRFCVLRPELVASFCVAEAAERSQSSARTRTQAPEAPCNQDISSGDVTVAVEGGSNTDEECAPAPFVHGISSDKILLNPNVFTDFKMAGDQEEINADESVVRKAGSYLVDVISDFDFNSCHRNLKPKGHQSQHKFMKGQIKRLHGEFSTNNRLSYMHLTSEGLWSRIQNLQISNIRTVRCKISVGITIAARKYDLGASVPFQTSDILNLQPVVKHSVPTCSEAKDLMESGKARLSEGLLNEAYTLFSEAFSILQQITGPLHRDVASCCRYLAMVLYHAGDIAGAIVQQHKELIINERCLGLDHPDTAHSYGNIALFYHGLNQTELGLRHMSRTLLLLSLSSGPDHPDVAATFINVAMMYQDIGNMETALRHVSSVILVELAYRMMLEFALTGIKGIGGGSSPSISKANSDDTKQMGKVEVILSTNMGVLLHLQAYSVLDITFFFYLCSCSYAFIITLLFSLNQVSAQKQKGQTVDSFCLKAIHILKANPELAHAFQTAARSWNASLTVNKSLNTSVVGEALLRGRGVDERAAQAVAEARKKAAARGILVRQNAAPVQPLPPLSQLLNIINSSSTPDAPTSGQAQEEPRDASNGWVSDGSVGATDASGSGHKDQAPVGLGTSLASLDSKKQS